MSLSQIELTARIETVRAVIGELIRAEAQEPIPATMPIFELLLSTVEAIHEINDKLQKASA